jgi:hypothetical protein
MDTSKVPPPKSNTRKRVSLVLSYSPYATAAAVGSEIMRSTFRPASSPARLVAFRLLSSKYAGTLITASVTSSPRKLSASSFRERSTRLDSSSGLKCFPLST